MSLSAAKLALAVKRARSQSDAPDILQSEPIAVIGMGCRLPGGLNSPDAYWQLLHNGGDAIVDLPRSRWPSTPLLPSFQGGFLPEVDRFDADFFGIPRREAERLDAQHRLLLEVVWESLWDAGLEPATLAGECNGVFVAIYNSDYFRLQFAHPAELNAYSSTGTSHSAAVGRVSFLLDWKGPSVAVDSACSSSLVSIHLACQSLRMSECRVAVAGGVSLILAPDELISLARMGMLSADYRCKAFDSRADGFVPGEGCGIVVLKRLSDALMDGDNIRAVIRGTAVNQDGRTTVLTAPNGLAQQEVIRRALANAHISGSEISYLEAHGTGTALGDPIEVEALAEVLGNGTEPCAIGSAKTNLGHLEAAAGVTGLMKVVLALQHEEIPPSLHFRQLNPHIQLEGTRLVVADRRRPWRRGPVPRFAGVSSFGFGGTNAHIVLEEAPLYPSAARTITPHQWNRQRYWYAAPQMHDGRALEHPLLGYRLSSPALRETVFENSLGADVPRYLGDHRPGGEVLLPMTAIFEMFLGAGTAGALEDMVIQEACKLPAIGTRRVQVLAEAGGLRLFSEESGTWKLHATASVAATSQIPPSVAVEDLRRSMTEQVDVVEWYKALEQRGLCFGPAFRRVEELWKGRGAALARVRPGEDDNGYRVPPALLDGCFQALGALLPETGTYVPCGVKRFEVFGDVSGELWSNATLHPDPRGGLLGEIRVFYPDGRPAAVAEGVWLRKLASADSTDCLCGIEWQPSPLEVSTKGSVEGTWLLLADSSDVARAIDTGLTAAGARCVTVRRDEPFNTFLADRSLAGVVYLWALDARRNDELQVCDSLLQVAQGLLANEYQKCPRLVIVTAGAQIAEAGQQTVAVSQAPLLGLARTIRLEHPELDCVTIDLDPQSADAAHVLAEIRTPCHEPEAAWRDGSRLVPGLVTLAEPPEFVRLTSGAKGSLEGLCWQGTGRRQPGAGEVEIRVAATGLNFRDVLNALGEYPGDAGPLGSECSGWIIAVGPGVTNVAVGDEVMGVARDSFASFVTTPADLVARKPAALTMEEAATLPIAWITARFSLGMVAGVHAGERLLIHAAAGGVGLAAVAEAQRLGAEIFATAGSEEKRAYLRSLGVQHVMSSRNLDYQREIMELTGGRGIDVVLNSLSGEHISGSLNILASGGRFLELGKKDIWDPARASALRPDVTYRVIDWSVDYARSPGVIADLYRGIVEDAGQGALKPSPCRTFSSKDVVRAFRWMAQAKHIGKIAVRQPRATIDVRRDATYLVTGGLGALGLQVAAWLASHGAGELVLVGRSEPGEAALSAIDSIRGSGTRVVVKHADISRREDVESILRETGGRLRGVVHTAGVIDDGVLTQQNRERVASVMAPKIDGSWHLHELTAGMELDFFILFSSLASLLGSPGQGNYAAANAFLDGLAHHRHTIGLPALSLNWGPWEGAGMAANPHTGNWQRSLPGLQHLPVSAALKLWEQALQTSASQLAAFRLRSGFSARDLTAGRRGPGVSPSRPAGQALHGDGLLVFLQQEVAKVMSMEEATSLDPDQPLFDAGLDSLMAIEFRNVLADRFARPLPSTVLFDYPTLRKLAGFLDGGAAKPPLHPDRLSRDLEALDEWEAEALLNSELTREY